MPAKPQKAAMTPAELKKLIAKSGRSQGEFADLLKVARNTVNRWANGHTPIGAANALLIKDAMKKLKIK